MSRYPLDITLACSVALQGGLEKYRNILPPLPQGAMYFIKDWNSALISEFKRPVIKKHLGAMARGIILLNSPRVVASVIDKIAVPYRSFYYAKRFTEAYNFASGTLRKNPDGTIMDFGRGLSPLTNLISLHNPNAQFLSIDTDNIANDIFAKVTDDFGISHNIIDYNKISAYPRDTLISLGTFAYIPKIEAEEKLLHIAKNFQNIFIELDLDKSIPVANDDALVRELGTEYQMPWKKNEITKIFGPHYKLHTLAGYATQEGLELYDREFKQLRNSFEKSNESFLQK